ncbi:DUF4247 domain-containing protein [Streptomyces ficellus]|uniref:DUF4247 domain-containing protein n=1 Tax=Streptomyces ficellus TaxID=1977088 RepID=A0ABT7Z713_9ACTN|nr:DUF4247 domain-containing protein [Streptomyces ficellus]MDN3295238.1 DUF4247 domain-containing protein [Streptomyces ficellus]
MKTARLISVTMLATVALTACSSEPDDDDGGNGVPLSWIRQEYGRSGAGYIDSRDRTSKVADEIHGHTSARDRTSDGDMVFLRYRDDIVAISPYKRGSRIEVDDYRSGYKRWRSRIGNVWPDPDTSAFRGGGPGSGK